MSTYTTKHFTRRVEAIPYTDDSTPLDGVVAWLKVNGLDVKASMEHIFRQTSTQETVMLTVQEGRLFIVDVDVFNETFEPADTLDLGEAIEEVAEEREWVSEGTGPAVVGDTVTLPQVPGDVVQDLIEEERIRDFGLDMDGNPTNEVSLFEFVSHDEAETFHNWVDHLISDREIANVEYLHEYLAGVVEEGDLVLNRGDGNFWLYSPKRERYDDQDVEGDEKTEAAIDPAWFDVQRAQDRLKILSLTRDLDQAKQYEAWVHGA